MATSSFKARGPLTEDDAKVYISREADEEARNHLLAMDYLLLMEPRHQGKTSLIYSIKHYLALENIIPVYIDVTTPDHSSEESWYQTFCPRLLRPLSNVIGRDQWPQLPRNSSSWRDFLSEIAAYFTKANRKVVIALDGIGAVTFPGATEFFTVLRDIYNSRQFETEFKYLTLLLSGAFHPRDLIKDDKISPFNVAQRVRLKDFTLAEVQELVSKGWPSEQAVFLAERIHYWTDGQPYLTQLLCTYLRTDALPSDIDAGVERLRREDRYHLPRILQWLNQDKKLLEYVGGVRAEEHIKFFPSQHDHQAQLELLGVLKADKEGYCRIRNRIYELALYPHENPTSTLPVPSQGNKITMDTVIQPTDPKSDSPTTQLSHSESHGPHLFSKKLSGKQLKQIHNAILDGYDLESLRIMVRVYLDERLHDIVSGDTFSGQVFTLIEWAEKQGRLIELVRAAYEGNPNNAALQMVWSDLQKQFAPLPEGNDASFPRLSVQPESKPEHNKLTPVAYSEGGWTNFKLHLAHQANLKLEVRVLETPIGQPYATSQLPYGAADLATVLRVLENRGYNAADFTPAQIKSMQRLGLVRDSQLAPDYLKLIGKGLYDVLFPGDVGVAFRMVFNQARHDHKTVFLQLCLDPDAVDLARYPWELLHDGHRHLISGGAVEMARYITYSEAVPNLPVHPPGRLLFVELRPKDWVALPAESERRVVWDALQPLNSTGKLKLERLEIPTYDALEQRLDSADYHLIHFDGHGLFAKHCPQCQTINSPDLTACQNCQTTLEGVAPQGHLLFEDNTGHTDFVSTEAMENLLLTKQVRLIFLSACQTGMVGGETIFGGLGPGLIRAGVPAVVAMQFSVPIQSTIKFAESFYNAIARGETVSRAVAQGRRRLFRDDTWFIPTLYLRSQDDEGHIFTP